MHAVLLLAVPPALARLGLLEALSPEMRAFSSSTP